MSGYTEFARSLLAEVVCYPMETRTAVHDMGIFNLPFSDGQIIIET
jgi:hypothetical protein